ncbi:MAG: hypothetical protein FWJ70_02460 [Micromonosporaceae bacterium]|mgnify:CR=1 FL=1|jgi:hypothetical protein
MVDRTTAVDVLTLEDFQRHLSARLQQARSVLDRLSGDLSGRPPALGTFFDAVETSRQYEAVHRLELARARRLVSALEAVQEATSTIIRNYRTAEARNAATAEDIAGALSGVDVALSEGGATHGR